MIINEAEKIGDDVTTWKLSLSTDPNQIRIRNFLNKCRIPYR